MSIEQQQKMWAAYNKCKQVYARISGSYRNSPCWQASTASQKHRQINACMTLTKCKTCNLFKKKEKNSENTTINIERIF